MAASRSVIVSLLALCALSSCAGFRSMWRGMSNTNMTGGAAPPLTADAWVLPSGVERAPQLDGKWRVLVFFLPG